LRITAKGTKERKGIDTLSMIAAAHVMAGIVSGVAALSARAGALRVLTAFGLGMLSHVVLDAMPHSDYRSLGPRAVLIIVFFEITATMTIAWFVLRSQRYHAPRVPLLVGLAGATLPDVKFMQPWLPGPVGSWVNRVGEGFHGPFHASPTPVAVGLFMEIVATVSLIGVLFLLVRRLARSQARA
jgi:hypothetical protein